MKTIQKYLCEVCRTEYKNPEDAASCEKFHRIPEAIIAVQHDKKGMIYEGNPRTITVRMNDGAEVVYALSRR